MHLKILGSGTSQVSEDRVSASNYLEIGGKKVLVDCGTGALLRMAQAGIDFEDIDIVFISHFHIDHISNIHPLIWALKYEKLERTRDLVFVGPEGFREFYSKYIEPIVFNEPFDRFEVKVKEIENSMDFEDFTVETYSTPHTEESVAYKFTENGKELVIAGDTDYDEGLIEFSRGADVLLLECSHGNEYKVEGHLTPEECGKIAKDAGVKELILTHFYPVENETRLEDTRKIFENTQMVKDLMDVEI